MNWPPPDTNDHELRTKESMGLVLDTTALVNERTLANTTTGIFVVFLEAKDFGYRETIVALKGRGIECRKMNP